MPKFETPMHMRKNVLKVVVINLVIAFGLAQQGCLAVAWVAAVGVDSLRTGDVTFWPFERSWVSSEKPHAISEGPTLTSVVVLPVEGDADMGARLTHVLQRQTALRIERAGRLEQDIPAAIKSEPERSRLAQAVSQELAVDAVLFGRVVESDAHPSDWGWKSESSRRLYLYLVDHDGHLLWKDELPFTVVKGSKAPIEDAVQAALGFHLMDHVRDLGLDDIGYLPKRAS